MKGLKVLSLCGGVETGLLALQELGIPVNVEEKYYIDKPYEPVNMDKRVCTMIIENNLEMCRRVYNPGFKMCTLTCISGGGQQKKVFDNGRPRKLTEIEYERLQGVPDNFTNVEMNGRKISYSKRCSLMGNGWNFPTVKHILSGLKADENGVSTENN